MLTAGAAFGSWLNAQPINDKRFDVVSRIKKDLLSRPKNYGEPINVLLIGSDSRHGESARSDTLMLLHVNFEKKRVYVVSIPRDTRVYIPGRGRDKVNAAYAYGQAPLAIRTVESFLGIDLNHFVEVDFQGFKALVDTLGGIDITVDKGINDRTRQYRMFIPKGRQRMDGNTALNYVRYRHGDSDFERAARQQNFLRALADNTLQLKSILRLPRMIDVFEENVTTDMSKREMLSLGKFLRETRKDRLETVTLSGRTTMVGGISYVEPSPVFISDLMERMEAGRSIKSMKSGRESDKISLAGTAIEVSLLNGSGKPGLATKARTQLVKSGWRVGAVGNADSYNYKQTQIRYASGARAKAYRLRRHLFGEAIMLPVNRTSTSAIEVILGADYFKYNRLY